MSFFQTIEAIWLVLTNDMFITGFFVPRMGYTFLIGINIYLDYTQQLILIYRQSLVYHMVERKKSTSCNCIQGVRTEVSTTNFGFIGARRAVK